MLQMALWLLQCVVSTRLLLYFNSLVSGRWANFVVSTQNVWYSFLLFYGWFLVRVKTLKWSDTCITLLSVTPELHKVSSWQSDLFSYQVSLPVVLVFSLPSCMAQLWFSINNIVQNLDRSSLIVAIQPQGYIHSRGFECQVTTSSDNKCNNFWITKLLPVAKLHSKNNTVTVDIDNQLAWSKPQEQTMFMS